MVIGAEAAVTLCAIVVPAIQLLTQSVGSAQWNNDNDNSAIGYDYVSYASATLGCVEEILVSSNSNLYIVLSLCAGWYTVTVRCLFKSFIFLYLYFHTAQRVFGFGVHGIGRNLQFSELAASTSARERQAAGGAGDRFPGGWWYYCYCQ